MLEKNINQKILDRFNQLPREIQIAIVKSNWEQKIRNIAQKNNLQIGDAEIVESETFLVMLGVEHPENYTKQLIKEIGLDKQKAEKITTEVNKEIFDTIRQKLIELNEQEELEDLEEQIGDDKKPSAFYNPKINKIPEEKTDLIAENIQTAIQIKPENHPINLDEEESKVTIKSTPTKPSYPSVDPYLEPID